eukprot:3740879-Heterocapsa_arctica.AAC.1
MKPAEEKIRHEHEQKGRERATLADSGVQGEAIKSSPPKFKFAQIIHVKPLNDEANVAGKASSTYNFQQEFLGEAREGGFKVEENEGAFAFADKHFHADRVDLNDVIQNLAAGDKAILEE